WHLTFAVYAAEMEFVAQTLLVCRLKQAGTQVAMHLDGGTDDRAGSGIPSVFDFSVSLCLCGDKPHRFCLITSYNTILAATPTLSDSTCAACGMAKTSSICWMSSRDNPAPSLPIKIASGPESLA